MRDTTSDDSIQERSNGNGSAKKIAESTGCEAQSRRCERDDPAADPNLRRIAARVKRWREEAGLTLKELAGRAGVSASTVHKVENGQVSPTVSVLLRISDGLGRHPGDLVALDEDETRDYLITRGADRVCVRDRDGTFVEKAADGLDNPMIDLWRATIQPGASSRFGTRHDDGELILYCESGDLTVWLDGEQMLLSAGDSVHCKAWVSRRWENRSDEPVTLTVAITAPSRAMMRSSDRRNAIWKHTVDYQVQQTRAAKAQGSTNH